MTNNDVKALGNANCKKTTFVAAVGEKVPPETTRKDWSKVKGLAVSKTYPICGLTYDLVPRLFAGVIKKEDEEHSIVFNAEEPKKLATTVSNYLKFVLE